MRLARAPICHSLQLSLDGSRTGKHAPVHFIETVVRGVKHEAARNADSDPDRATVELDRNNDIMREPYSELLTNFLCELGTGVAGRGGDLNVELDRKSLCNHGILLPACNAGRGRGFASKVRLLA